MSNIALRVFIKKIFTYTKILIACLLLTNSFTVEAKSKFDVSMFPYPDEYRKDRKALRDFSVPIMNTSFLKLIKYEKIYSSLKSKKVDINSLNVTNVIEKVPSFQSTVIILPTISMITNIKIEIDDKIAAQTIEMDDNDTNTTIIIIDDEIDREHERPEGDREHERPEGDREHERPEGDREHERPEGDRANNDTIDVQSILNSILNTQLLEYIGEFDDTNFVTNISGIDDPIFLARINSIAATNALTFITNTTKMYNFDVLNTQTTNVLYSKSITNTNQINTVSRETINALEFHFASQLLAEIADNSRAAKNNSYVNFWVERKTVDNMLSVDTDTPLPEDETANSWTNTRTPVFSISSSKKTDTNDTIITNDDTTSILYEPDDGFEVVANSSDSDPIASFNVGDSIRFQFDVYEAGFVNIVYVSPISTNMSLLYPNNYNIGYATNAGILSNGLYQVPTSENNIELVLREAGISQVYLIYSKSEKNTYDLTKFQNGGFLAVRDEMDFAWHVENVLGKNKSGYVVEQITIDVVDITSEDTTESAEL